MPALILVSLHLKSFTLLARGFKSMRHLLQVLMSHARVAFQVRIWESSSIRDASTRRRRNTTDTGDESRKRRNTNWAPGQVHQWDAERVPVRSSHGSYSGHQRHRRAGRQPPQGLRRQLPIAKTNARTQAFRRWLLEPPWLKTRARACLICCPFSTAGSVGELERNYESTAKWLTRGNVLLSELDNAHLWPDTSSVNKKSISICTSTNAKWTTATTLFRPSLIFLKGSAYCEI